MAAEFKDTVGKEISFVPYKNKKQMFDTLGIENKLKKTVEDIAPFVQDNNAVLTDEEINEIKTAIYDFMTTDVEYNAFGDTTRLNVFEFYDKVSEEKIEVLFNSVANDAQLFTFCDFVDIDEYFKKAGIDAKTVYAIPIDSFNAFIKCWVNIRDNHPDYKRQFVLKTKFDFDSVLKEKPSTEEEDLPF